MSNMLIAFLMGAGIFEFVGIAMGVSCGKSKIEILLYTIATMVIGGIGSMILCSLLGL